MTNILPAQAGSRRLVGAHSEVRHLNKKMHFIVNNKMIIESLGGSGDNDLEKEDKIIKKISKQIIIEK